MSKRDLLFREDEWYNNPLFSNLRTQYQAWRQQAEEVIKLWPNDGDEPIQQMASFYLDAVSPVNMPFLNPQVIQKTWDEQGENLKRGYQKWMQHMADSQKQQNPFFLPPLVEGAPFEVGENIAATPGHVIWEESLFQLIRYTPKKSRVRSKPLVIVPPWINKYYILDLSEHNSFVNWCVEQGFDTYILSWVNPDDSHTHETLENYTQAIARAIRFVNNFSGETAHTLGYCVGGVGLLLALVCQPQISSGITLLTTPIDFEEMQPFNKWLKSPFARGIESNAQQQGIIHGQWFSLLFSLMRPQEMIWKNTIQQYFLGEEGSTLDFLFWNSDVMNVVGKLHQEYLHLFFHHNIFMNSSFEFLGKERSLSNLKQPMFILNTKKDHIVPPASSMAARKFWPHAEFVLADSGHVAGVVNPPSLGKYGYTANKTYHDGSWWSYWADWLTPHLGAYQKPKETREDMAIEAAPGRYVKEVAKPSLPFRSMSSWPFSSCTHKAPPSCKPRT